METKLNIIDQLRDILGRPDIMIVGSMALSLHGFNIEVNDVDMEITLSNSQLGDSYLSNNIVQKLLLLQTANPLPESFSSLKQDTDRRYDFIFKGIRFNIWIKKEGESIHKTFTYFNYCKVAGVLSVLSYIKEFGRVKDLMKINDLASQILNYTK